MAHFQKPQDMDSDDWNAKDVYHSKRSEIVTKVKNLLSRAKKEIDFVECQLRDLLYPESSEFANLGKDSLLHIVLYTLFKTTILDYHNISLTLHEIVS